MGRRRMSSGIRESAGGKLSYARTIKKVGDNMCEMCNEEKCCKDSVFCETCKGKVVFRNFEKMADSKREYVY